MFDTNLLACSAQIPSGYTCNRILWIGNDRHRTDERTHGTDSLLEDILESGIGAWLSTLDKRAHCSP